MKKVSAPRTSLNPPVFYTSATLALALAAFTVLTPQLAQTVFDQVQRWIVANLSWFYVLSFAVVLVSVLGLAFGRYGDIRLGPDHSRPEYKRVTWFAMLFSAGLGIGLMFFGVAEPIMHFTNPPIGDPGTVQAAREAMKITFFHWGLHAWGIYAPVVLLAALWGLFKALRAGADKRQFARQSLPGTQGCAEEGVWQQRLQRLVHFPERALVTRYINDVVAPACEAVGSEMALREVAATVSSSQNGRVCLNVNLGDQIPFSYEVRPRSAALPVFAPSISSDQIRTSQYFRAEVFLHEGGQGYCMMGWSREDVITDILNQYERHLQFLDTQRCN